MDFIDLTIGYRYGSDNPVFGVTRNAFNPKLSPGGSSSGTGALVGARGCLVGIGTDVGGSVRIPAHFNGVAGICPTPGRLSVKGCVSPLPNVIGRTCFISRGWIQYIEYIHLFGRIVSLH